MREKKRTKRKQKVSRDWTKLKLVVCGALVLAILLTAVLAPYITPYDPYEQDLGKALLAPCREYLLGTDRYGRDMLSRVIMGARTSVFSAVFLVLIITVTGSMVGTVCGYQFPGMVFAIAAASVLKGGLFGAVAALALISWPKYARIVRSQVMSIKNAPYIEAARLAGSGTGKIILKHMIPNIAGPVITTAVLDIGTMMMEIAGLSFLGLGAMPPAAEWGSMMSSGRSMLQTSPWVILAPGCAIFLTVIVFNLLGDTVRDLLDPRQRKKEELPL